MLEAEFQVAISRNLHEWYTIQYIPDADIPAWTDICRQHHKRLALIYSRPNPGEASEIAVIVSILGHEYGYPVNDRNELGVPPSALMVQILSRAWVRLETNHSKIGAMRAEFRQNVDGAVWGEVLEPEQLWCVV